jgi:hypothetical protein
LGIDDQKAQGNGMSLTTDGNDYEVLARAAARVKGVPGLVLEIGTRRGGSAKIMVDALQSVQDFGRTFILLDPYGNIPYNYNPSSNQLAVRLDYTNQMRAETIPELLRYGWERQTNMMFLNLEDTEYMARFSDYFPVYSEVKYRENKYALVYYDGPHDVTSILKQTQFFADRSWSGTRYVYDDHAWYDHGIINEYLAKHNFECVELVGQKVSYVRTK